VENLTANSHPAYVQLRHLGVGNEAVSVANVELKRDAAVFHLKSGTVCFTGQVEGKVTGAVFKGTGSLTLDPPAAGEKKTLKLLTHQNTFNEEFNNLVLRFTDDTYAELKKGGTATTGTCDSGAINDIRETLKHKLHYNLDARILQDVLSPAPGGLFLAFIHGNNYNSKEIFAVDPQGGSPLILSVAPEEVQFVTYDDNKQGIWASYHLASEYANNTASSKQRNSPIHIELQQLDTSIDKSATLRGKATTTFVSQVNGLRVVPFDLFGSLRVKSVADTSGEALAFVQEDKKEDPDFFVVLAKPLAAGDKFTIVSTYEGKDAVTSEGSGNYYPVARDNWYPNNIVEEGERTQFEMSFRIPKGMKIAATGDLVSQQTEGSDELTVWKSAMPLWLAGFNFGRFKEVESKMTKPEYLVQSYVNVDPPDWVKATQHAGEVDELHAERSQFGLIQVPETALGSMSTVDLGKKALAQGELSVELFSDYFGPSSLKRLAISQQTACDYGQSWPGLVWLPTCSFFDSTLRHSLGLDFGDRGYWTSVTAHEVAHQWWGNTVGFASYRDQWMSEGFADMSAALYLQMVEKNPQKTIKFWNDERELLTMRNKEGFRAIDAGPLTLGYRNSNSVTGFSVPRMLIYPKGAYVLHMVRMMMFDRQTGDQQFKAMMQEFVNTYAGKDASTDDFKAMVEKHMNRDMDLAGNHTMDWFFDEYVHGTALPNYKFTYSFESGGNGQVLNFKVVQSNVDDNFRMVVPLYLELANGNLVPLGRARMVGNTTIEQKVPLPGLKDKPKRAMVNYFDDVLATAD
jgi:hypothetical protein